MAIPVKTEKFFVGRQLKGGSVEFLGPEQTLGYAFHSSKVAAREELAAHVRHGYEPKELGIYQVTELKAKRVE